MRKSLTAIAMVAALSPAATALAGINVYLPNPTVVIGPSAPPPQRTVVMMPPPPPTIVIQAGDPDYWFWDDNREVWFYYDVDRRPHYVRRHVYVDDGRHYFVNGNRWASCREDNGRHKGWYKREKHERHERREREREHEHGHGRGHGHGHDHDDD